MTSILARKAQWEQEARDDERRLIAKVLRIAVSNADRDKNIISASVCGALESVLEMIERGDYRKGSQ